MFGYELSEYENLFDEKLDLFSAVIKEPVVNWTGSIRPPVVDQRIFIEAGSLKTWVGVGGSPNSAAGAKIPWGPAFLAPIAKRVRDEVGIPVSSGWGMDTPEIAERVVRDRQVDLVKVRRAMLANPHWPYVAAVEGLVRRAVHLGRVLDGIRRSIDERHGIRADRNDGDRLVVGREAHAVDENLALVERPQIARLRIAELDHTKKFVVDRIGDRHGVGELLGGVNPQDRRLD
ncbi:hypothetical protein J5289_20125 [Rhizobium sp. B230/85]|nr:hypothetical protein [Rhizobium sp. B209b/85]QXZ98843.1 hypothetical protein J5289_20125 [Rhizobium sp. B230/85]